MIILGVDPGLGGALAFRAGHDGLWAVYDIPTLRSRQGNKREIDAATLVRLIAGYRPGHAFVEDVHSMPKQGVSSTFAFGKAYGVIIGILAANGVPMTFVSPRVWKKALGVPASKDGALARASQLLPDAAHHWPLIKHDGRAEAALIALFGLRSLNAIAQGREA